MKRVVFLVVFTVVFFRYLTANAQNQLVTVEADTMECLIVSVEQDYISIKMDVSSSKVSKVAKTILVSYFLNGRWVDVLDEFGNEKGINSGIVITSTDSLGSQVKQGIVGLKTKTGVIQMEVSAIDLLNSENSMHRAGNYLESSSKAFYAGVIIGLAGTLISALSAVSSNTDIQKGMLIGGAVMGVSGSIVSMTAFIPISRAGLEFKKIKFLSPSKL